MRPYNYFLYNQIKGVFKEKSLILAAGGGKKKEQPSLSEDEILLLSNPDKSHFSEKQELNRIAQEIFEGIENDVIEELELVLKENELTKDLIQKYLDYSFAYFLDFFNKKYSSITYSELRKQIPLLKNEYRKKLSKYIKAKLITEALQKKHKDNQILQQMTQVQSTIQQLNQPNTEYINAGIYDVKILLKVISDFVENNGDENSFEKDFTLNNLLKDLYKQQEDSDKDLANQIETRFLQEIKKQNKVQHQLLQALKEQSEQEKDKWLKKSFVNSDYEVGDNHLRQLMKEHLSDQDYNQIEFKIPQISEDLNNQKINKIDHIFSVTSNYLDNSFNEIYNKPKDAFITLLESEINKELSIKNPESLLIFRSRLKEAGFDDQKIIRVLSSFINYNDNPLSLDINRLSANSSFSIADGYINYLNKTKGLQLEFLPQSEEKNQPLSEKQNPSLKSKKESDANQNTVSQSESAFASVELANELTNTFKQQNNSKQESDKNNIEKTEIVNNSHLENIFKDFENNLEFLSIRSEVVNFAKKLVKEAKVKIDEKDFKDLIIRISELLDYAQRLKLSTDLSTIINHTDKQNQSIIQYLNNIIDTIVSNIVVAQEEYDKNGDFIDEISEVEKFIEEKSEELATLVHDYQLDIDFLHYTQFVLHNPSLQTKKQVETVFQLKKAQLEWIQQNVILKYPNINQKIIAKEYSNLLMQKESIFKELNRIADSLKKNYTDQKIDISHEIPSEPLLKTNQETAQDGLEETQKINVTDLREQVLKESVQNDEKSLKEKQDTLMYNLEQKYQLLGLSDYFSIIQEAVKEQNVTDKQVLNTFLKQKSDQLNWIKKEILDKANIQMRQLVTPPKSGLLGLFSKPKRIDLSGITINQEKIASIYESILKDPKSSVLDLENDFSLREQVLDYYKELLINNGFKLLKPDIAITNQELQENNSIPVEQDISEDNVEDDDFSDFLEETNTSSKNEVIDYKQDQLYKYLQEQNHDEPIELELIRIANIKDSMKLALMKYLEDQRREAIILDEEISKEGLNEYFLNFNPDYSKTTFKDLLEKGYRLFEREQKRQGN